MDVLVVEKLRLVGESLDGIVVEGLQSVVESLDGVVDGRL